MPPVIRATAIFLIAASLFAVAASMATTYVFNWYDLKFKDALGDALKVQLFGLGAFVIVASVVFALAFQFLPGKDARNSASRIALAGAIYPVVTLLLGQVLTRTDPESWINPAVGWLYMIGYPLLAVLLVRRWNRTITPSSAGPSQ